MRKVPVVLAVILGAWLAFGPPPALAKGKGKKIPARAVVFQNKSLQASSTCTITCAVSVPTEQQFLQSLTACSDPVDCCCKACLVACQVDECGATDGHTIETCAT